MTKDDLAATVMRQGMAFVNKVIEEDAGYVAGSKRNVVLTLSKGRGDTELQSLPRVGESGMRRYQGRPSPFRVSAKPPPSTGRSPVS